MLGGRGVLTLTVRPLPLLLIHIPVPAGCELPSYKWTIQILILLHN